MKVYFTIICLLVAAFGMIHSGADNPIDKLVKAALEVIRKLLKKYEPYVVPDMPEQTVQGDDILLKAKFTNVKISKASDFTIDHIENNLLEMWAKFAVTLPTMHVEGDYITSGLVKGKHVTGQGNFKLDITNMVTGGYVELEVVDFYIQMKTLDIYYTIEGLKFSADGLSVEGLTPEQLEDLFSNSFLKYCQDNEKFISSQVSAYVKQQANDIMQGKTLQQLLDWLKKFIHQFF
uniref:Putative juvenile hormone binding protein n=1 Tax=Panstrongylus lignarius TaxID=156445 RepID=A0A224XWX5_9HEMI